MNWFYGLTDKTAASWGDRNVYGILSIYSDGHLIYKLSIWVQIDSAILFCVSLMHLQMILLTLSRSSSATKNLFTPARCIQICYQCSCPLISGEGTTTLLNCVFREWKSLCFVWIAIDHWLNVLSQVDDSIVCLSKTSQPVEQNVLQRISRRHSTSGQSATSFRFVTSNM